MCQKRKQAPGYINIMCSYLHAYLSGILAYFRRHISRHYVKCFPRPPLFRSISLLLNKWIFPAFSGSRFCHGFCTSPPENGSQPNQKQQIKTLHGKASAAIYKRHRCFRHYHSIALWHPLRFCRRSIHYVPEITKA